MVIFGGMTASLRAQLSRATVYVRPARWSTIDDQVRDIGIVGYELMDRQASIAEWARLPPLMLSKDATSLSDTELAQSGHSASCITVQAPSVCLPFAKIFALNFSCGGAVALRSSGAARSVLFLAAGGTCFQH
jgi:hypothetical protein